MQVSKERRKEFPMSCITFLKGVKINILTLIIGKDDLSRTKLYITSSSRLCKASATDNVHNWEVAKLRHTHVAAFVRNSLVRSPH
jgi:hypothetical protein